MTYNVSSGTLNTTIPSAFDSLCGQMVFDHATLLLLSEGDSDCLVQRWQSLKADGVKST